MACVIPDWAQANPTAIARALSTARAKSSGGWLVLDATRTLIRLRKPVQYELNDRELVVWVENVGVGRQVRVAPGACPHMGAHFADGHVTDGCIVCPWHGLALPGDGSVVRGQKDWRVFRTYDDGVLTWVQLDPLADDLTDAPALPTRPEQFLDGVVRTEAVCEPQDVIANRLDPWHGTHFHPYAFTRLTVTDHDEHALNLRVAYRVLPGFSVPALGSVKGYEVEVGARFHCPEPNTIVMTITEGEGVGSVVETHASPIRRAQPQRGIAPRTAIIEATLATSERPGFTTATKGRAIARPIIRALASRLWRDDAKYAERLYDARRRAS